MKIDNWATCLSRYCHWFVSFGSNKSIQSWGRTEATSNNSKAKGLVTRFTRVIFRLRDSSPLVHNTMYMYPSIISDTFVYQNYSFSDTFVYHNTMYMYPSFFFSFSKKKITPFFFFFYTLQFLNFLCVLLYWSKTPRVQILNLSVPFDFLFMKKLLTSSQYMTVPKSS